MLLFHWSVCYVLVLGGVVVKFSCSFLVFSVESAAVPTPLLVP